MKTVFAILILAVSLAAQAARETTEFTLFKRTEPTLMGAVGMILKGTDAAKQRFTIELQIDGRKLERKDLDIQVPFYFYVGSNTQAHELVITKVSQDQIVGRLVSPQASTKQTFSTSQYRNCRSPISKESHART